MDNFFYVSGFDREFTVGFSDVNFNGNLYTIVRFTPGKAHTRSMDRDLRRPRAYRMPKIKAMKLRLMFSRNELHNYWFALDTASYFAS